MAYNATGFKTISHIGSIAGSAGTNRAMHAYVTEDDAAAVETADYFLPLGTRLKKGDMILASLDIDATPAGRLYVVTAASAASVAVLRFAGTSSAP